MGRGKVLFTIREKLEIVDHAYSRKNNIKPTSRLYGVLPSQIRRWKKTLAADRRKLGDDGFMDKLMVRRAVRVKDPEMYEHLDAFFDTMRSKDMSVSIGDLVVEAFR